MKWSRKHSQENHGTAKVDSEGKNACKHVSIFRKPTLLFETGVPIDYVSLEITFKLQNIGQITLWILV